MPKISMKKKHAQKGFTLLELAITAAFFVVALSGSLVLFNHCYNLSIRATETTVATAEAYSQLEEIRVHNYDDIMTDYNSVPFAVAPQLINGIGTTNITNLELEAISGASVLLQAAVTITWQTRGGEVRNLTLTTFIARRI